MIRETVSPDFTVGTVHAPTFGTAERTGEREVTWKLDYAGTALNPQTYSLSFDISHVGTAGGDKVFNESVVYQDQAGAVLHFPSPTVQVSCPFPPFYPEPCPMPTEIVVPHCRDAVHAAVHDVVLSSLGRIVQLDVTLKSICPGKRVAVSVILSEIGPDGAALLRGVKHIMVPAQEGTACRDLPLRCIQFSVPEALDIAGIPSSLCNAREFQAQVIANYVDTDFVCCKL